MDWLKKIILLPLFALVVLHSVCAQGQNEIFFEPSVATAKTWWQEQTNVWTPLGWPNNYMRFVVLYNGSLLMDPGGSFFKRPHGNQFLGNDFMLTFHTSPNGLPSPLPKEPTDIRNFDFGYGIQGWNNQHETPLLWTEFRIQSGLIVRAEMFSHQQGSKDVETALEPIYTWIRLKVIFVDPLRKPDLYPIVLQLSRIFYEKDDEAYNLVSNQPSFRILANPNRASYEKTLKQELYKVNGLYGMYVAEPDGKIRLGVLPSEKGRLSFFEASKGVSAIKVLLKGEVGDYVDLLVPMFPQDKGIFIEEQDMTYDGALTASDWYWAAQKPVTGATFNVPEKYITEAIERNLKFAPVIAEKDHITGEYSYLTGVWGYDALWPTPTSTVSHMLADQFGYHHNTALYSEIFKQNQGTIKPPGKNYYLHPGYFGAPKTLTSYDWLADHGAILLQIVTSAILNRDQNYINHWLPSILAACDFIKDMSGVTDHNGVKGLLPPAVASDEIIETQAVWNIAWNYKGLIEAVKLLKLIHHPRAKEFSDFAEQTKSIFQKAYREFSEEGKRWTDNQGRQRYLPPTTLSAEERPHHPFSDAFYLDTGPLILVWAGLMDADDPIMRDLADFFRYGSNKEYYTPIYNCIWRPSLQHEMSTCEPCYSWNIFHSWQLGDRQKFLEGMYSLFVGALSQNTYISCEHRHGIQGNLFVGPLASYLAKLAVVDDQIIEGELHLLRLCPQSWISMYQKSIISNIPTEYGPIDLIFNKSPDGETFIVSFEGHWHEEAPKVILHPVPDKAIKRIVVNGKTYSSDGIIVL